MLKYFNYKNYIGYFRYKFIEMMLKKYSKKINFQIDESVFIDAGANIGQAFEYFQKYFTLEFFDYILIEPNPNCYEFLKMNIEESSKIRIFEKALTNKSNLVKLYGVETLNKFDYNVSSSLLKEHNGRSSNFVNDKFCVVESMDIEDLIKNICAGYNNIILKLDVESSEYDILEKIIDLNLEKKIKLVIVEFHSKYMSNSSRKIYRKREQIILQKLKLKNIKVIVWI